ncbi:MAG TPA: C13 family peptidase [Vicinamibacterales bacterium]
MTARAAVLACLLIVAYSSVAAAQQTYVLLVTGVPGDEEHAKMFSEWAKTFLDAAKKKEGVPEANITYLSEHGATRAAVEKAFADIGAKAHANDELFVLLIGHGSFDGTTAAFNLMGPDLTAEDYARLLSKFTAQRVVFVNTSSSSGAFLKPLAAPGRVIVTATKTGGERNDTDFPRYFVAAFADDAADRDRNGHVSVAEAFEYAKTKVVQSFSQKGLLLTEHATLEDSGEGQLASAVFLSGAQGRSALQVDTSDPELRALAEQKDALDRQIAALRAKKATMDPGAYDAEMEQLLTALALKTKEIRDLQAKKK